MKRRLPVHEMPVRHFDAWAVYGETPGHDGKGDLYFPGLVRDARGYPVGRVHNMCRTRAEARELASSLCEAGGWRYFIARVRIITVWRAAR